MEYFLKYAEKFTWISMKSKIGLVFPRKIQKPHETFGPIFVLQICFWHIPLLHSLHPRNWTELREKVFVILLSFSFMEWNVLLIPYRFPHKFSINFNVRKCCRMSTELLSIRSYNLRYIDLTLFSES